MIVFSQLFNLCFSVSLKTIRTVQVAKHLGISSRDLREKILSKVNFGVKSTDKVMSFSIACGIVRYASRMLKISCPPLDEEINKENIDVNPDRTLKRSNLSTLETLRGIGEKSQGDLNRLNEVKKEEKLDNKNIIKEEGRVENKKPKAEEKQKVLSKETKDIKQKQVVKKQVKSQNNNALSSQDTKEKDNKNKKEEGRNDNKNNVKKYPQKIITRKIELPKLTPEEIKLKKKQVELERMRKKEEEEQAIIERKLLQKKRQEQIFTKKTGTVVLPAELSVKEFSEKIGIPANIVVTTLVKNGIIANLNQYIDFDTASIIAEELEVNVKKEEVKVSSEDLLNKDLTLLLKDDEENLVERPPVVAVIGHVDHGKTSILDAIRKTRIVDKESGGITQHIGAYSITKDNRSVTFLDTPGHEAFTSMRSRGAKTADIVILVVAADDGVKDQTKEAINHAKAAGVSIIVAANKIDKEGANLDKLKSELSEAEVQVEEWGGTVPLVPVSALKNEGIDDLLEMIFLQADLLELKANPNRLAVGTVIESHQDIGLGPVATILVNTGTMKTKDLFLLGSTFGKVKTMIDDQGKKLKKVMPSGVARISGMEKIPEPGDVFQAIANKKELKNKKQELESLRNKKQKNALGVADIIHHIQSGEMKNLNLIIKTDTIGSLEAITQSLNEISNKEVSVSIIHSAVGSITESDVMMSSASKGFIISFHSVIPTSVMLLSEKEGVEIKEYSIIYDLIEEVKNIVEGMLEPEIIEEETGVLQVKEIFYTKGKKQIIGGKMISGYLEHPVLVNCYRKDEIIDTGRLIGIKHFNEKVKKIESPKECGLSIEGFTKEILEGDLIKGVVKKTIIRKLSDIENE